MLALTIIGLLTFSIYMYETKANLTPARFSTNQSSVKILLHPQFYWSI